MTDNQFRIWWGACKVAVALLVVALMGLAACMPVMPESAGTPNPVEEATTTPSEEATPAATEEATAEATTEPTEEATAEATEEPTAEAAGDEGAAVAAQVAQQLAQQLQIDAEQVEVVSVEAVDWPDACLGVYTPDIMCAQVITPGYRVILSANGNQYEYHTNGDGSYVELADAPEASVGDVLLSWEQTQETCQAAQFGRDGVAYGPCMGVMMGGQLVTLEREQELAGMVATYAPFEADTAAGSVTLNGEGSTQAGPAEQRMVAEWARLAAEEVAGGRGGAGYGVAFSWHREGGLAGFCDDLTAYITGQLYATSCKGQNATDLGHRQMTAEELEQLYGLVDHYASFDYAHDDGDVDDAMQVSLRFTGNGDAVADENEQQDILAFAGELYATMSQ